MGKTVAKETAMSENAIIRLGLISDTHGLMRPEALEALRGVDHIIHAGDVGRPDVLNALRALAPVTAVRGNVDVTPPLANLPETQTVQLGGVEIHVLHKLTDLDPEHIRRGARVVIFGHTHEPEIETREDVLYINPGSAGPRRFRLPVTVCLLTVTADGALDAEICPLAV